MKNKTLFFSLLLLGIIGFCTQATAQDSLYTKYGDVLIGKIEKITFDKIYFKTSYRSSAVDIKLSEIVNAKSSEGFLLNDIRNKNWRGNLVLDSLNNDLIGIKTADSVYFFEERDIFELSRDQKKKFKDKFKLGIDAGYTRAKSNNSMSLSLGLNTSFRTRRWDTGLEYKDYGAIVGLTIIGRTSFTYNLSYILPKEWFFNGKILLYSSTEQSLDQRRNFTLGLGKNLIYRRAQHLSVTTGLVSNYENYTNSPSEFKSTEGMFNANFNGRLFEHLDLTSDWTYFKSFDDRERFRNSLSLDVRYIFLNHFNIGIHYVLNTDSKPPVETSNRDYVFEVKFGWTLQRR
ncbi:DUF481 domain-containing protein [uncultured Algoriphagus sp.]|uniref:DUF481 domain-containing protein n=1 Tax=uncultured Algoriphagus sp. TaxID=417365 RepID=UPI0030EDAE3D|tara:strand:+ start:63 stop:1097 length:1035 start_codon:yes stop_codon:yes gene_type:complete